MMLAGALISTAGFMLVGGLTPATQPHPMLQAAVALLVPLALAALTPLRRLAIPLALGGLAMTSLLAAGTGPALGLLGVPALAAALTTRLGGSLGRAVARRAGEASEPGTPGTPSAPGTPAPPATGDQVDALAVSPGSRP